MRSRYVIFHQESGKSHLVGVYKGHPYTQAVLAVLRAEYPDDEFLAFTVPEASCNSTTTRYAALIEALELQTA